jgi:hypothetical protein
VALKPGLPKGRASASIKSGTRAEIVRLLSMTDSDRLTIIREHVGKAQAILAEFIDPKSGAEGPVTMKRLANRLKHHLDNRELVRALNESDGEQKIGQADAKSIHRAKNHQAA